jgi:type IV pilus assembly protein PilM
MRFSKPTKLIGVDIGSQAIKVCQVDQSSAGITLEHYGQTNLPPLSIQDGSIKDHQVIAGSLATLLGHLGISIKEAAFAISGYSVIIKKITLPLLTEKELAQTIHLEAEQHIPFDVREVNLDFQILGPLKDEPDTMAVLLIAGKKDILETYQQIFQAAGLEVKVADVTAFSLQNAYEVNYPLGGNPIAALDLGSDLITVNVFNSAGPLFIRDLPLGGRQITEQIQNQANLSFKEAEQTKLKWDPVVQPLESFGPAVLKTLASWAEEIKRAFDFLAASDPESRPTKVVLSGGSALIPGLAPFFSQELKLPVELFNPFNQVKVDPEMFDRQALNRIAPQAVTALGLALRRKGDR